MDGGNPSNILNITTFNFYSDPMKSSKAWVNILLFNGTNSPGDLADLLFMLNLTTRDSDKFLFTYGSLLQ